MYSKASAEVKISTGLGKYGGIRLWITKWTFNFSWSKLLCHKNKWKLSLRNSYILVDFGIISRYSRNSLYKWCSKRISHHVCIWFPSPTQTTKNYWIPIHNRIGWITIEHALLHYQFYKEFLHFSYSGINMWANLILMKWLTCISCTHQYRHLITSFASLAVLSWHTAYNQFTPASAGKGRL